jgi:acetyltransferase-like isoleucine patch superfamily enzyme
MRRWALQKWVRLCSRLRRLWYPILFPGLRIGTGVLLDKGVRFDIPPGGIIEIGDGSVIEPCCNLGAAGYLSIGPRAFIGFGSILSASERVTIGEDALIAAYCMIRDQDHGTDAYPYRKQPSRTARITIGKNVWLGSHVTVLKGVVIGDNAIVGAGAVVTRSLSPGATAVGVPARQLPKSAAPGASLDISPHRGEDRRGQDMSRRGNRLYRRGLKNKHLKRFRRLR